MPLRKCAKDGKPGYKVGNATKCWTYTPTNENSRKKAKKQALKQWYAMNPEEFKKEVGSADFKELNMLDRLEILLGDQNENKNGSNNR